MMALTSHLRPAPYQYGILTLRLLGKLGGKNRIFLQEPMDIEARKNFDGEVRFDLNCGWDQSSKFKIMLPIQRSMIVLRKISALDCNIPMKEKDSKQCGMIENIFSNDNVEDFNLSEYKEKNFDCSTEEQAKSAFVILRSALSTVLNEEDATQSSETQQSEDSVLSLRLFMQQNSPSRNKTLKLIFNGLFCAANIEYVQQDALLLLHGLSFQVVKVVANSLSDVCRESRSEDAVNQAKKEKGYSSQKYVSNGKLQPLIPFGCFAFTGQLKNKQYCLVLNEAITEVLKSRSSGERKVAINMIEKMINYAKAFDEEVKCDSNATKENEILTQVSCKEIFVENLLHNLCNTCLTSEWQERNGIFDGIVLILDIMGSIWSSRFEVEIMHVALFCIKDQPQEVAFAEKEALSFFFRLISSIYDTSDHKGTNERIYDSISLTSQNDEKIKILNRRPVSEVTSTIMIGELGSSNPAVRYVKEAS